MPRGRFSGQLGQFIVVHSTECFFSVSPRKNYIIFSTSSPPAVQRIPWPAYDESETEEQTARRSLMGHDTWILSDHELPWLLDPDGRSLVFWRFDVTYQSRSYGHKNSSLDIGGGNLDHL